MSNNFTIIKGNADTKNSNRLVRAIALYECWQRQFNNAIYKAMSENRGKEMEDYPQKDLMKIALSGIKYINSVLNVRKENKRVDTDYRQSLEESHVTFKMIDAIFAVMGCIKLKNLVITFPIKKDFNGEKWGYKDYFHTMDVLSKMDWDKPVGRDNISDLLWDYENDDLRHVYVEFTHAMSAIYRSKTGKGITEQFCDDMGIPTYTYNKETGAVMDNKTGQSTRLKSKSHLQIVK